MWLLEQDILIIPGDRPTSMREFHQVPFLDERFRWAAAAVRQRFSFLQKQASVQAAQQSQVVRIGHIYMKATLNGLIRLYVCRNNK